MTEAEWLACEDPIDMLRFVKQWRTIRKQVKQRKQRLFAIACCRRLWSLIDDERTRRGIEVVERFADGQATSEELLTAETESNAAWLKNAGDDISLACLQLFGKDVNGMHASTSTLSAAFRQQQTKKREPSEPLAGRQRGAYPPEERAQCALIRDIFGNPFRPVAFSREWRTDTAVTLARQMYEAREFGAMPILADALQDAGCDSDDILAHCRGPGPHVRGCWVCDLVLGFS